MTHTYQDYVANKEAELTRARIAREERPAKRATTPAQYLINKSDCPYWAARRDHVEFLIAEGLTRAQIGARLGISQSRVWMILRKIERMNPAQVVQ